MGTLLRAASRLVSTLTFVRMRSCSSSSTRKALRYGPSYLHRPDIAQIVVDSIHKGVELGHYELRAYVVVPNHVHLLTRPSIAAERLMKSLKGASAREANRVLGRIGGPFWQKESYHPWVRNPQDYPWSSAGVETSADAARKSVPIAFRTTMVMKMVVRSERQ
jgi:REP element-mobilizing transposase RayT